MVGNCKKSFWCSAFSFRGYVSFRAITSRFAVFWNHQIEMDLLQQSCAHQACILYCTLPQNLDNPGKSMVGRCTVTSYWNSLCLGYIHWFSGCRWPSMDRWNIPVPFGVDVRICYTLKTNMTGWNITNFLIGDISFIEIGSQSQHVTPNPYLGI